LSLAGSIHTESRPEVAVKAEADFVWRRGRFLEFGYIRRGLGKQRSRGSGNEKRRRNYLRKLASAFS
jgi:hypothetical protein